jgi:AbrB family looped-hinge helix DNA binding protein
MPFGRDSFFVMSWPRHASADKPEFFTLYLFFGNGIIITMKTTIDNAGRLVIPKEIRTQAGLTPGTVLDIRWRDGCIEIAPAPLPVELVRKGRLLVAIPKQEVDLLTADRVEETRRAIQQERSGFAEET